MQVGVIEMPRRINKEGFALIRNFEGLRLKAYPDPGTGGDPWTIGYGHTGPDVKKGLVITVERADDLLMADLSRFERCVADNCGTATDNQFSAMVSLCFNIGCGAFEESTLLRLHRAGKYDAAAAQFDKWVRGGGRVLPGLVKRRAAERALYSK